MNAHLRRLVLAIAGIALISATPASTQSLKRPQKQYSVEQFMTTVAIQGASFSPDESRILFSSNKTGIWNAYTIPVTGGEWSPVTTSSTESTYAITYFLNDDRILLTRDQGGNELNHLYVRLADGQEKDLTPGAKLKAAFGGFTPDGDAFWVQTNERDPRFFDVYRYDAKTYERTLFYENRDGYFPAAVSNDGKWVALSKIITTSNTDVYLWNAATKTATHLSPHTTEAQYQPATFDPASTSLYYTTNDDTDFMRLRRYSLIDGKHQDVEKADWDIGGVAFSKTGKYRVLTINEDGRAAIRITETATGKVLELPSVPSGGVAGVTIGKSEASIAFYVNGDRSPNDLFFMKRGFEKPVKLTSSLNPEIDPADLVDTEVVRFKARDGIAIPNILWKPHQATASTKAPAVVLVHGGPGGQTTRGYSAMVQYLVNHGYVVLGINNRGSSGYGRTFFAADDQKHGREPLWDCVDAKTYLASLPYVDGDRVGIVGGSYGGYMVLAALAYQPDVFDVGVDIFGVSNWVRTLESIPAWWEAQRTALYAEIGDPVKHKELLREISPAFHGEKIRKPLMVLQGANDPRVLKAESDDIVTAVKKNGVPVEYMVFPDEGHGFSKKKNQIEGYSAMLKFLDTHLKGKTKA
ncbi:MAG: S9 family peptidase [Acidobacteria bacterium]|nr:S9 family peptidase [Acidobacteriota bacterium]